MKSEPGVRARERGFLTGNAGRATGGASSLHASEQGSRGVSWVALLVFSVLVSGMFALIPTTASAATVEVQTKQVIAGSGTCTQPTASGFKAYEYDGHVDSFDIEISDPAYIAVSGAIGDKNIPFSQMTRRMTPSGALRIHADIESTPRARSMPIALVLISAKPGAPVCITLVVVTPTAAEQSVLEEIPQPVAVSHSGPQKSTHPREGSGKSTTTEAATSSGGMGAASASVAHAFGRIKDTLHQNACGSRSGTSRLWFIFLVLYVLALGAIALSRPPTTKPYPLAWLISAIFIPIFLLISFWYVLSVCGVSRWIPIVAVIAGLAGIAIALRGSTGEGSGSLLLLAQESPAQEPVPTGATPTVPMTFNATSRTPMPIQQKPPTETKESEKPVIITPPPAKPESATAPDKEPHKQVDKGTPPSRPPQQPPKAQ